VSAYNTFLIALNGLLPQIRSTLFIKEPTNLQELLKYATLIESSVETDPSPYVDISQSLQEMKEHLARLQPQLVTDVTSSLQTKHMSFKDHQTT